MSVVDGTFASTHENSYGYWYLNHQVSLVTLLHRSDFPLSNAKICFSKICLTSSDPAIATSLPQNNASCRQSSHHTSTSCDAILVVAPSFLLRWNIFMAPAVLETGTDDSVIAVALRRNWFIAVVIFVVEAKDLPSRLWRPTGSRSFLVPSTLHAHPWWFMLVYDAFPLPRLNGPWSLA